MLTRCPSCQTTFRVTPEQLQAKSGRVRCGQCQHVFNALEHLAADPAAETILVAPPRALDVPPPQESLAPTPPAQAEAEPAALADAPLPSVFAEANDTPPTPPLTLIQHASEEPAEAPRLEPSIAWDPAAETMLEPRLDRETDSTVTVESAEPSARKANTDAGFEPPPPAGEPEPPPPVAGTPVPEEAELPPLTPALSQDPHDPILARDHTEIPGYSKWAQAPLAGGGIALNSPHRRPTWPFALAATLLALVLAGQATLYWRTELSTAAPFLRGVFASLGITVPLPRITEKVSLEASDLQSDANRGLLVLQATLHNRASFPQAYPSLDLALTDVGDHVVLRRTLAPVDYLPPGAPAAFAPGTDQAVKVWLDIKPLSAAGYRLVVFYP